MRYIDCKQYAQEILDTVKAVENKKELMIISMGDDPASQSYIKGKISDCEYCGIPYSHIKTNDYNAMIRHINSGNVNPNVGGIIVQLPLPDRYMEYHITNLVDSKKDVDGFKHDSAFKPCTPEGIVHVIKKEFESDGKSLDGARVLIIGRGKLVGKPLVDLLLEENCTVSIAHSHTTQMDMNEMLQENQVVVSAVGIPHMFNAAHCSAEYIIDAGISRDENGKLCGDFNSDNSEEYINEDIKITPVPGGIGRLTRAMLMKHMAPGLDTKVFVTNESEISV